MKLKSYATDKDFLVGIFLFENSFVQSRLNLLLKLGGGVVKIRLCHNIGLYRNC